MVAGTARTFGLVRASATGSSFVKASLLYSARDSWCERRLFDMTQAVPQVCQLSHGGFRLLGEPVFRLSEGARIPSMVVQLESQEAVLPLRSVAREFGVDPASADGQMLTLIEQALDFVVALRLGDKLPSELNGGESSWTPSEQDRKVATSRVWHDLVRCVFARMGQIVTISGAGAPGWEDTAANQQWLRKAIDAAVTLLGGPDAMEVAVRAALVSEELACIETMRRILMRGMAGPQEKLLRIQASRLSVSRRDTMKQVQGLARRGLKQVTSRFDKVDACLDDILAMLRDTPAAIAWLRHQRDWLFRTKRAWEPVFADWANAPSDFDESVWKVVERTYSFLAPRFMSFQEWTIMDAKSRREVKQATVW